MNPLLSCILAKVGADIVSAEMAQVINSLIAFVVSAAGLGAVFWAANLGIKAGKEISGGDDHKFDRAGAEQAMREGRYSGDRKMTNRQIYKQYKRGW